MGVLERIGDWPQDCKFMKEELSMDVSAMRCEAIPPSSFLTLDL
jgi:hypothetical protein